MGDEEKGFTIVDRRAAASEQAPAEEPAGGSSQAPDTEQPPVDFGSFCLSLATSALYHMGVAPHPEGGEAAEKNLPLARHTIDSLEMLERKTRGNLDDEEAQLLQSLLYELRMRYVEATSGPGETRA